MPECFDTTIEGHVAHIELNRPDKRNSLLSSFWSDFPKEIDRLSSSGEVRAIIISGAGKQFCSGMDLSVFAHPENLKTGSPNERERFRGLVLALQDALSAVSRCRVPVIAAIQGACVGAGLDLACACDFRYATESAYFCIQEINIGIMADLGTLQRLPLKMPDGVVREMAFAGINLDANRAHCIGFVNRLFADRDEMLSAAKDTAKAISAKAPLTVSLSKESIEYAIDHPVSESLRYAANLQTFIFDQKEIESFVRNGGNPESLVNLSPTSRGL